MQQFLELTISGIVLGGIYSLVSLGLALPLNVFKIANLGHGALTLSGPLLILIIISKSEPLLLCLVKILILINLWIVIWYFGFRHLYSESTEETETKAMGILVIGIGILSIVEDLAPKIVTGGAIYIAIQSASIDFLGVSISCSKITLFIFLLIIYLLSHLILKHTDFGKSIIALSEDKTAAVLLGIDSKRIYFAVYCLTLALTIVSGLALVLIMPLEPQSGLLITIKALIVISLSRQFRLIDIFVIAVSFGIFETFVDFLYGNAFKNILVSLGLVFALKIKNRLFRKHGEIYS